MIKINVIQRTALFIGCSRESLRIMKFSIIFLLVIILNIFSSKAESRNSPLNIDVDAISSQQYKVKGTVTDKNGIPLPGVTVVVAGTTLGIITDINGEYSIDIPQGSKSLKFSFIGMVSQEISIGTSTRIAVTLTETAIDLEEVVVVGYGTQKKATLTGAVGTIKSTEVLKRPAANTTELLQGQVAGLVSRQSSGLPGSDATILNIRGYGNPLVIVDGVQSGRSLEQMDPNEIESISVLKDASAAIYGARAGNGVILVTTKRGKEGPFSITYTGNISFATPTYLPEMVDANHWAEMLSESGVNPDNYTPNSVKYNPATKTLYNVLDGTAFKGYNWSDAIYRKYAPLKQHNINASGGNKNVSYFISAGFTDQESNFKSGDYDFSRYNLRSNIDAKVTENIGISVDFSYRSSLLDKANFGSPSDLYNDLQTAKPVYPVVFDQDPTKATQSGFLTRSPYFDTFKKYSGFVENREKAVKGAVEFRYSFPMIKGLIAKARLNYEESFAWDKSVNKTFPVYAYDAVAASTGKDPWTSLIRGQNKLYVYSAESQLLLPLLSLEYQKVIGNHNFSGVLVGESQTFRGTSLRGDRRDMFSYEAPYLRYASEIGKDNTDGTSQYARSSIIGRINYGFKGKYLFEFTMRADASAEYPPEGRWGYFPSLSAGWRISDESFIKDNFKAINNLKLRASYGILGNDAVSSFAYLSGYNITSAFHVFGTSPAPVIASSGLANPDVTWESLTMYNVGLDGNFWNGLLGFQTDVFYRLSSDILAIPIQNVPSTFGAALPLTNLNKRDKRGFEITLTHRNTIGKVTYDISPIFSYSRGKYVEWEEVISADQDWNNRYGLTGEWDDKRWGYLSDGFFETQDEITNHKVNQDQAKNQTIKVGDIKYKDLNNDGVIDWKDETVISTTGLPKTIYSLIAGVEYKGFRLSTLFMGGSNYVISFGGSAAAPFDNESIPLTVHYENRAIVGKDSNGKDYITNPDNFKLPPATQNGLTSNNRKSSDFWNYDAIYLRLKNLNLSYSLPKKIIKHAGFNECIFYFSGTNLWTISNLGIWKNSFDPEVIQQDNKNYPPVKTITFGLKLTI